MSFAVENLKDIEEHLKNHPTLTEGGVPGPADAHIFVALGKLPNRQTHPNLHYWYLFVSTFSPSLIQNWAGAVKPTPAKPAAKKPADDEDVDLFGDDEPVAKKQQAKPVVSKAQPKVVKKPKPAAKSIVVFQVKIYDPEATNLDELAKRILALEIDGLVWNNQPKKLDVAFGIQKLSIGCVIEDDKVLTDDIFDQILAWEDDVQSVDMTTMQKL